MKKEQFLSLFSVRKPIIGMVHLGHLAGQAGYTGLSSVVASARRDISAWQAGGVSGLIIENWHEDAVGPFIPKQRADSLLRVVARLRRSISVPFGVNVLNNDYEAAYRIAAETGAAFIQLDTLVDRVVSDFIYNEMAKKHPFVVDVSLSHFRSTAKKFGLDMLPVIAGIHPKHYRLMDARKTLKQSAIEAERAGVSGIVITKATGVAPLSGAITRVSRAVDVPVGTGSGLTPETATSLLRRADFAIVGTFAKKNGVTDNPVDEKRVEQLMRVVYDIAKSGK